MMKPPRALVMESVRETLKIKDRYCLMDIVRYCNVRGIKTTKREVMLVIVDIVEKRNCQT